MATITEHGNEVIKNIMTVGLLRNNKSYPIWFFNKIVGSVTYNSTGKNGLLNGEVVFSDEHIVEGFRNGRYWLDHFIADRLLVKFIKSLAEFDESYFTDFEKKCMGLQND